jgi:hypothetical protein
MINTTWPSSSLPIDQKCLVRILKELQKKTFEAAITFHWGNSSRSHFTSHWIDPLLTGLIFTHTDCETIKMARFFPFACSFLNLNLFAPPTLSNAIGAIPLR